MIMTHFYGHTLSPKAIRESKSVWAAYLGVGALAVGMAVSPMLIKNGFWLDALSRLILGVRTRTGQVYMDIPDKT